MYETRTQTGRRSKKPNPNELFKSLFGVWAKTTLMRLHHWTKLRTLALNLATGSPNSSLSCLHCWRHGPILQECCCIVQDFHGKTSFLWECNFPDNGSHSESKILIFCRRLIFASAKIHSICCQYFQLFDMLVIILQSWNSRFAIKGRRTFAINISMGGYRRRLP